MLHDITMLSFTLGRCKVSDGPWEVVSNQCNCTDLNGTNCQLILKNDHISCKEQAGPLCRESVALWAQAYRNAENANDPRCRKDDHKYIGSQIAAGSCYKGNN